MEQKISHPFQQQDTTHHLDSLTFQSLLVTGYTNKFNVLTTVRFAHTVFMCFVFV
jgi:hypothetical protein